MDVVAGDAVVQQRQIELTNRLPQLLPILVAMNGKAQKKLTVMAAVR
jgi:hypothetical protein